jgi:hypothetical protein
MTGRSIFRAGMTTLVAVARSTDALGAGEADGEAAGGLGGRLGLATGVAVTTGDGEAPAEPDAGTGSR